MHSQQVNFYLNLDDQASFDSKFLNGEDIVLCKYITTESKPKFFHTTLIKNMGFETLKIIVLRKVDIEKIIFRPIKGKNSFAFDTLKSPVVEYSRCYLTDTLIRRGRLYFIKDYYDENDTLIRKDHDFVAWADKLLKKVRKDLSYDKNTRDYYGNGAEVDRSSGIKMVSS